MHYAKCRTRLRYRLMPRILDYEDSSTYYVEIVDIEHQPRRQDIFEWFIFYSHLKNDGENTEVSK